MISAAFVKIHHPRPETASALNHKKDTLPQVFKCNEHIISINTLVLGAISIGGS